MGYLTDKQAADEVSKWKVDAKNLKPALVTRQNLWDLYNQNAKKSNLDLVASMCEMGLSTATALLTGPAGAFDLMDWVADSIKDAAADSATDTLIDKGYDVFAGAYLTDLDNTYTMAANKKFATKVASGFLTIVTSIAGGTLAATTGIGAAVAVAFAIIVWIGEGEQAAQKDRWTKIVKHMEQRYQDIRAAKYKQINELNRTKLERLVMSNAQHDLEDAGGFQYITYKLDNTTHVTRYSKEFLKQLMKKLKGLDEAQAKQLRTIDVLEVARIYRPEALHVWDNYERAQKGQKAAQGPEFDKTRMQKFMARQIQGHVGFDYVAQTKLPDPLKDLGGATTQVLNEYAAVDAKATPRKDSDADETEIQDETPAATDTIHVWTGKPHAPA